MTNKLEKELQVVTGVKRLAEEEEQAYLLRLVTGVADLPEAAWNKLSEAAQEWYNGAAEAVQGGQKINSISVSSGAPSSKVIKIKKPRTTPTIAKIVIATFLENPAAASAEIQIALDAAGVSCTKSSLAWYIRATKITLAAITANGKVIS